MFTSLPLLLEVREVGSSGAGKTGSEPPNVIFEFSYFFLQMRVFQGQLGDSSLSIELMLFSLLASFFAGAVILDSPLIRFLFLWQSTVIIRILFQTELTWRIRRKRNISKRAWLRNRVWVGPRGVWKLSTDMLIVEEIDRVFSHLLTKLIWRQNVIGARLRVGTLIKYQVIQYINVL